MRWSEVSCLGANWLFRELLAHLRQPVHPQLLKTGFQAGSINNGRGWVPNIHRASQFYQEFFGMPLRQQSATVLFSVSAIPFLALSKPEGTLLPSITSISEIANFNANDVHAKLRERCLKSDSTSKEFVHVL